MRANVGESCLNTVIHEQCSFSSPCMWVVLRLTNGGDYHEKFVSMEEFKSGAMFIEKGPSDLVVYSLLPS